MKNIRSITKVIIVIFILQFVTMGIIVGTSKVQLATLATDDISDCNEGWSITTADGQTREISTMPYYGKSEKNEIVVASKKISTEMCGKTLCFLSADKRLQIFADDQMIYSFGMNDKRFIGSTPGSVMVFADIPEDASGKTLKIEMQSPYENYASYMTKMVIGDRDVAILYFLKSNIMSLICCLGILACGIILMLFAAIQRESKQEFTKLFSIGMYFIVLFVYHLIETKVPMIFYGNQVLYSNLVFFSLMLAPFFTEMYLYAASESYKNIMRVLMILTGINIIGQLTLQILNIVDFMDMAFISHGLLTIVIAVVLFSAFNNVKKKKKIDFLFVGVFTVAVCAVADLVRCYTIKVGDLGKYSRFGVLIFGISVVVTCINDMVVQQIQYAENKKAEKISEEIIKTLVTAIDAKDIYTKGHSTRVAEYAVILAKRLGWDEDRITRVRYKALLHDIGKIGIPDRVLNKADRLSDEEFEVIKSHTTIGADMLKGVSSLSDMYLVARNHHERYDGKGYPDRVGHESIPEEARLVGIVDAYDAMSSDRAYRKALPMDVIRKEIIRGRGTQFDPNMTDVFLELLDEGALNLSKNENESVEYENDVLKIVSDIISESCEPGAIKMELDSMGRLYQYINGMHTRYGIDFSTVLISLEWEDDVSMSEVDKAMKALEYSILQSLRKVDVMSRVSESQYLIVLTEAHTQNIQMIIERVFASFFKNCQNTKIKPVYEIK